MTHFEKMLSEQTLYSKCLNCSKYLSIGNAFYTNNEFFNGNYWYYETDSFIIDIHDFFIKKERIVNSFPNMNSYFAFVSSYVIVANGDWLHPYQNLTANTMFIIDASQKNSRFLLHGNYPYKSVGINFKEKMIQDYIIENSKLTLADIPNVFLETRENITSAIKKIAFDILNCQMDDYSAKIFLEAKAKEWLSITLNEYCQKTSSKNLSLDDQSAIESVADYITNHLSLDIPQSSLESIAMMSGTKLKTAFKRVFNMSITEYTQRKRINVAENLLLTTNMSIQSISNSVGYESQSRFTTLYKRYRGITPKESRLLKIDSMDICKCNKLPQLPLPLTPK